MAHVSIFERKRDLVYLVYFGVHFWVMLAFDLQPLYPASIIPQWMSKTQAWYVATYADKFFVSPPPWFKFYSYMEALYHLPLTLWAIPALLRNDPRVPLQLCIYATQVSITTATCLAEMWSWEHLTPLQRGVGGLGGMYGAYLAVGVFMAVDMFARVDKIVARAKGVEPVSAKKGL
jgi:hypothetical protein